MGHIHPVFNAVKLLPASKDLIVGYKVKPSPPPKVIEGKEHFEVKEILDNQKTWDLNLTPDQGVRVIQAACGCWSGGSGLYL
ncbi:hypothetical protein M422DRAFT_248757 [Sphaerobolus stellatus SS14]|nr:hypothetical protein M422DRAFT_248757 [Sphaerobolus stellatus SS14]